MNAIYELMTVKDKTCICIAGKNYMFSLELKVDAEIEKLSHFFTRAQV